MQLTTTQKTALKAHMGLNTNTATRPDGVTFAVNTRLQTGSADDEQAIADWYNAGAKAGDAQPFANRNVWNSRVTVAQLNSGIKWDTPIVGATAADRTEMWLLYQSMIWNMSIDMTDAQVRKGLIQAFGDTANGSANGVAGSGGQVVGKRVELALAAAVGAPVGAVTNAWAAAYKPVVLADGTVATNNNAALSQADVHDLLVNG